MWLELKGKYAICARGDASSGALEFHSAEMDDAVTVFKSRLVKSSDRAAGLKAAAGGFNCPGDIKTQNPGGRRKESRVGAHKTPLTATLRAFEPDIANFLFSADLSVLSRRENGHRAVSVVLLVLTARDAEPSRLCRRRPRSEAFCSDRHEFLHRIYKKTFSNVCLCRIIPPIRRLAKTSTPSIILPPLMGLT